MPMPIMMSETECRPASSTLVRKTRPVMVAEGDGADVAERAEQPGCGADLLGGRFPVEGRLVGDVARP